MREITILDSNKDYIVCVKPSGVTSEDGKTAGMPTLLSNDGFKPLVVHRLDREVSGVMVFARNSKTAAELTRQITDKTFQKEYLAVVGGLTEDHGVLEDLLYHDRVKNKTYTVSRERKGVKSAKLEFWRIATAETDDGVLSLVRIRLFTGRTHQIRVQFGSRRHPVFGDRKYGSATNGQPALFSRLIGFKYKENDIVFTATPENIYPWAVFSKEIGGIQK